MTVGFGMIVLLVLRRSPRNGSASKTAILPPFPKVPYSRKTSCPNAYTALRRLMDYLPGFENMPDEAALPSYYTILSAEARNSKG
jgi:hypothetical protein